MHGGHSAETLSVAACLDLAAPTGARPPSKWVRWWYRCRFVPGRYPCRCQETFRATAVRAARLLCVVSRNLGLVTGLVKPCCYLAASVTMGVMAYLPEDSQGTLGWLYVGIGVVFAAFLWAMVPSRR